MTWFVLYTERKPHGEPCQQWAENVFLHDRWEVCESEAEAAKLYEQIIQRDSTHTAGMGQMTRGTDHWEVAQ